MDQYISEFLYNNYHDENYALKLLAWLIIDKKNTASSINRRLTYAIENQDVMKNKIYLRKLDRYKNFYETHLVNIPQNTTINNKRISTLQISDFRGFGKLSDEDKGIKIKFNKLNNIFFAPNGGGKSSLCEALEYQTTGDIKEAGRRKTSIKNYIKRNGKHSITLLDHSNRDIKANPDYNFNFIDRNRLQEFSLLGSSDTKFGERDVLAALVGLESFDSFLGTLVSPRSFNALSFRQMNSANALESLNLELIKYKKLSNDNHKELLQIKKDILIKLGCNYHKSPISQIDNIIRIKHPHLKKYLVKLETKKEQIKKGIPSVEISLVKSSKIINVLSKLIDRKKSIDKKLDAIIYNDKLIKLHTLSKELLEDIPFEECPLCNTPNDKSAKNPLENSKEILKSYIKVTTLQKCRINTKDNIKIYLDAILQTLRAFLISPVNTVIKTDFGKLSEISNSLPTLCDDEIKSTLSFIHTELIECESLEFYNETTAQHNSKLKNIEASLTLLNVKIDSVSRSLDEIRDLISAYKAKNQNKNKKKEAFDSLLNKISSEKEKHSREVERNLFLQKLNDEYSNFHALAYTFKRIKESQILAGIEGSIVHYYNEINKHDDDSEKLDSLSFIFDPSLSSYRIQLDINGEQADAFVRLSEGHLKSLGLSVLLALAKKKKSQFIVFDDVVNAIDTEHRSNIINTFLTDPYIKKTQKIITTHDKLFWELYSNREKSLGNGEFSSFILNCYPHGIHYEERDISFEGKISDSLEHYDIRQALIYCRIWFESLAAKHCVTSGLSLTASFSERDYQKPNFIKISLEKMYAVLTDSLGDKLENINLIKNDFLSWGAQNQEHHAFSENNYNIIHSKTSQEIQGIFDAIRKFNIQLSPQSSLVSLQDKLAALNIRINGINTKIDNASPGTPADILHQWNNTKAKLERDKIKVEEMKNYCENLLL